MALTLHNLRPAKGAKKKAVRRGRGNASGAGNYSGRGMKGQRARSGGKGGLKLKGMKANIQNLPKLAGFKSYKDKPEVVNVGQLDVEFKKGDTVTSGALAEKGLVSQGALVKVLGDGKLSKALTVKVDMVSQSAYDAITKAGGTVLAKTPKTEKASGQEEKPAEKKEEASKKAVKEKKATKKSSKK